MADLAGANSMRETHTEWLPGAHGRERGREREFNFVHSASIAVRGHVHACVIRQSENGNQAVTNETMTYSC